MSNYRFFLIDFKEGDPFNTKIFLARTPKSEGFDVRCGVESLLNNKVVFHEIYVRINQLKSKIHPLLLADKIALNLYLLYEDQRQDELIIDLSAFKTIFGYGRKYRSFSDFKNKVILPSIVNFTEHTDLKCSIYKMNHSRNTLLFQLNKNGQRQSA